MTTWVASTNRATATNVEFATPITLSWTEVVPGEDGTYTKKDVTETFTRDTADYRLAKFKVELKDWFNVDSTIFYYIFTHLFLMVDSRAKNAFPTYYATRTNILVKDDHGLEIPNTYTDGGNRWFWLPYDMDTCRCSAA